MSAKLLFVKRNMVFIMNLVALRIVHSSRRILTGLGIPVPPRTQTTDAWRRDINDAVIEQVRLDHTTSHWHSPTRTQHVLQGGDHAWVLSCFVARDRSGSLNPWTGVQQYTPKAFLALYHISHFRCTRKRTQQHGGARQELHKQYTEPPWCR